MEFNEKLQQLRTGKNLTQEQLAEQLYVSRGLCKVICVSGNKWLLSGKN